MIAQTISLFRYLLLGFLNRRLVILLSLPVLLALLAGGFIAELAMINGEAIVAGLVADFLRYFFVLLIILLVSAGVAEDYEFKQFERLLTMPLSRWQYVVAQTWVIATLCMLLVIPVFLMMLFYSNLELAFYWSVALWLELLLVGTLTLLAVLSLEKVPQAFFLSLTCYLLAKMSGFISLMLAESVKLSDASALSQFTDAIFSSILYVIPGSASFAENDVFFSQLDLADLLVSQFATVSIYVLFLLMISTVDFYRKEFNF